MFMKDEEVTAYDTDNGRGTASQLPDPLFAE